MTDLTGPEPLRYKEPKHPSGPALPVNQGLYHALQVCGPEELPRPLQSGKEYPTLTRHSSLKRNIPRKVNGGFLSKKAGLPWWVPRWRVSSVRPFPPRPSSQQVHPVLQQLLLGFAREAEGGVLGAGEAGAPCGRRQLLEIGFLDGVAAGVHGRGGISRRGREKLIVRRRQSRSQTTQTVCACHRGPPNWKRGERTCTLESSQRDEGSKPGLPL